VSITSQPKERKGTHGVDSLYKTVCGKEAFHRLCSIIGNWRDRSKPLFETDREHNCRATCIHHCWLRGKVTAHRVLDPLGKGQASRKP
jgi:hypothetical protein